MSVFTITAAKAFKQQADVMCVYRTLLEAVQDWASRGLMSADGLDLSTIASGVPRVYTVEDLIELSM